jgi:hypothetical protein
MNTKPEIAGCRPSLPLRGNSIMCILNPANAIVSSNAAASKLLPVESLLYVC